jgi:hypothetical protein
MKRTLPLFLFVIFSISALAQKNYLAKDLGYTSDVKMVEELEYRYNPKIKKYVAFSNQTLNFANGKLIREDFKLNNITYNQGEKVFTYKDGFPEKYSLISNGFNEEISFKYTNGKLTEQIEIDGDFTRNTTFSYNTKGQKTAIIYKVDNEIYRTEEFKNYTNDNSYVEVVKKFENNKLTTTVTSTIKNGLLFAIDNQPDFIPENETRIYDSNHNIIQYTGFDGVVCKNVYVYDSKGNPNQLARCGNPESKYNKENTFVFTKIYYNNSKTSGATDLDENFVKQFDTTSESYDFDATFSDKKTLAHEIIFQEYEFMKKENNEIAIHQKGDVDITNTVAMVVNKNNLDIIIYDSESQETAIAKDFYDPKTPLNKWITMQTIEASDSEMYWLVDDQSALYFITLGQYVSTDSYTIIKSPKSEYDLIIQQDGENKYILVNPNMAKPNTLNPLEYYYE